MFINNINYNYIVKNEQLLSAPKQTPQKFLNNDTFEKKQNITFAGLNNVQKISALVLAVLAPVVYHLYKKDQQKALSFEKLPQDEKQKLLQVFDSLFKSEKNVLLTLISKKPSAYTTLPAHEFETFCKYRNLFESDTIKFVAENPDKQYSRNFRRLFIMNVPETKKIIDNNIDFFRYRLNDKSLTTDQTLDILLKDDSPLLNIQNYHDFIGLCLGFPLTDTFLFKAESDIDKMIRYLESKDKGKSNQAVILKTVFSLIRPDLKDHIRRLSDELKLAIQQMPLPKPQTSFPETSYYRFITWDKQCPEMKEINQKIQTGSEEVINIFHKPSDVLDKMLELKQ
ncbi:MAG: hypothetical protein AB1782_14880 [Cyanobacteriota bacterium]